MTSYPEVDRLQSNDNCDNSKSHLFDLPLKLTPHEPFAITEKPDESSSMITRRFNLGDESYQNGPNYSNEPSTMDKSKVSLIHQNAEIRSLALPRIGDSSANTFLDDLPVSSKRYGAYH